MDEKDQTSKALLLENNNEPELINSNDKIISIDENTKNNTSCLNKLKNLFSFKINNKIKNVQ